MKTFNRYLILGLVFLMLGCTNSSDTSFEKKFIPTISEESWRICEMPDLGELNGSDLTRQHIVDHGFIQANNGKWQLWACMRGTSVGRILYGWEGESLTSGSWESLGVVSRADSTWGEKINPETIQAPFFMKSDSAYLCFYNSSGIRLMTSQDGIEYKRIPLKNNNNILYKEGGRDVMVYYEYGTFYAYSTVSTVARDGWKYGYVILRTSKDLIRWSDYTIVSAGGVAGNGPISSESPFVIKYQGYYYLFRASSITALTYVYRSDNPYHFGVNDDSKLIASLPLKAVEIIQHSGQWYISDLADFQGIVMRKLIWKGDGE
ncbi:hypothetical protein ACFLU5_06390 [Bacteroidota bacterium]